MSKKTYYTMSFTWGLPMTILGLLTAAVLIVLGHKPKRFGWAWYFEIGNHRDGFSLGFIFFCGKKSSNVTKAHEYGHSIQNCKYGLIMPFFTIASAVRYWYYTVVEDWLGGKLPDYELSWRFESNATKLGIKYLTGENK